MKEICSNFDIILVADVASVIDSEVIPVEGASFDTFSSEVLSVSLIPENSDAGISYSMSQDIIIDKVSHSIAAKYNWARYCILIIYYTDGTYTVYGSYEYPVVVYLTPGVQRDTLSVSLQTTDVPVI